jgi:FkbM family methyltransferase
MQYISRRLIPRTAVERAVGALRLQALGRRRRVVDVRGRELAIPRDLAWAFARGGQYYERNVTHWFELLVRLTRDPIVYDVGAHCGYYSLLAADAATAIYAFEPIGVTYSLLSRNISQNSLVNVHAYRVALGNRSGEVAMAKYNASGNNSLIPRTPGDARAENLVLRGFETVRVVLLDDIVGSWNLPPPNVLKLDTEGSELPILQGGRRLLARSHPVIIMEHNEAYARDFGYTLDDVCDELAQHGYSMFGLRDAEAGHADDLTLYQLGGVLPRDIGTLVAWPGGGT